MRIDDVDGGARLPLLVVPGASRAGVAGVHDGALRLRVVAPPEKGKANAAVCALLASVLGLRKGEVRITAGHGSRRKTATVSGLGAAEVRSRLGASGGFPSAEGRNPGSPP